MNKIILMGRLTRTPEIRYSNAEVSTAIANFSIAVDRKIKRAGDKEADFFNCTAFGKQAEFVEKYLQKGTKILLTGHVQNNNYTTRNGEKVYSIQVIAEEIEFAESKNASIGDATQEEPRPQPSADAGDDFMNIPDGIDEELPFN